MSQTKPINNVLALDVGDVRIGVARMNMIAKLPQALPTLLNQDDVIQDIKDLCEKEQIDLIIVGLPRDLKGNETKQTHKARGFAERLKSLNIPIKFQDEALTSVVGEERLKQGKKGYEKADIDGMAAAILLEDYLRR